MWARGASFPRCSRSDETGYAAGRTAHAESRIPALRRYSYACAASLSNCAPDVAGIEGLDTLKLAPHDEIGLVQLRKLLQDAELRDDERKATYSIQRSITSDQFTSSLSSFGWFGGFLRSIGR
jgi:hypothetical protein